MGQRRQSVRKDTYNVLKIEGRLRGRPVLNLVVKMTWLPNNKEMLGTSVGTLV